MAIYFGHNMPIRVTRNIAQGTIGDPERLQRDLLQMLNHGTGNPVTIYTHRVLTVVVPYISHHILRFHAGCTCRYTEHGTCQRVIKIFNNNSETLSVSDYMEGSDTD